MAEAKQTGSNASAESGGPRLEVIDRVKSLPVVQSVVETTGSTYSYLKDSNYVMNWLLSHAEAGVSCATATVAPITASLANNYEGQIKVMDEKLCQGLNIVEQKAPIVKQPPQQIFDAAKAVLNSSLQPTMDKLLATKETTAQDASRLKEISIEKANELLNNQYGTMAVQGIDNTGVLVNKLLDLYFPPIEGEENVPAPVSAEENMVLHSLQTIGQLSTKAANRIYHSIVAQLKTVKQEDLVTYLTTFISILHIISYLKGEKK